MAKVITFSRQFPKGHPKAGQPTYFVEQVLNALEIYMPTNSADYQRLLFKLNTKSIAEGKLSYEDIVRFCSSLNVAEARNKLHTIRSGNRWKAGEIASPRVWTGTPYNSPQIIFAPEVMIKSTPEFMIHTDRHEKTWIDIGSSYFHHSDEHINKSIIPTVAKNDGLSLQDFLDWFKYPNTFFGQILCWKEVDYV